MAPPDHVIVGENPEDYREKISQYLEQILKKELSSHGLVSIGVSGGSMPGIVVPILLKMQGLNWKRIKLFMCDERVVPADHADSNYGQYVKLLPEELKDVVVPIEIFESTTKTASHYESSLRNVLQTELVGNRLPRFDLLLLGMGPDGHTCSLFPNSKVYKLQDSIVVAVDDSPKPPPKRVSLSLAAINIAKNVAFLVTGEEKAEVIKSVLEGDQRYPSAGVKPFNGKLKFFLDKAAASKL